MDARKLAVFIQQWRGRFGRSEWNERGRSAPDVESIDLVSESDATIFWKTPIPSSDDPSHLSLLTQVRMTGLASVTF